ncbi:aminotransferase class IV [Nautilia sp.]
MKFIETVLITDKIENLDLHNKRMNKTRYDFFKSEPIDLKNYITFKPNKRVRITYSENIEKVEYFEIEKREFKKFKIVHSNIDYSYKYADRQKLNALKIRGFDEVIIAKNGLVTDTTISNLAFFDGKEWFTPKTPLLKGTKREELIRKGVLMEKEITPKELGRFSKIALINAVLGFFVTDDFDIIL